MRATSVAAPDRGLDQAVWLSCRDEDLAVVREHFFSHFSELELVAQLRTAMERDDPMQYVSPAAATYAARIAGCRQSLDALPDRVEIGRSQRRERVIHGFGAARPGDEPCDGEKNEDETACHGDLS